MSSQSAVTPLRSRGRPPKTKADEDSMRANIADATLQAFAAHGYHGMSVEQILVNANISRPTFYKYFRQLEEPLALAAFGLHTDLVERIAQALQSEGDALANAMTAFDAYVDWGKSLGAVLRPLYAEFYQTNSPVSQFRLQTIETLKQLIMESVISSGRPKPTETTMGLFITGIEFLAFHYLLQSDGSLTAYAETRLSMLRLLVATLGTTAEFELLMQGQDGSITSKSTVTER